MLLVLSGPEEVEEVVDVLHVKLIRLVEFVRLEEGHVFFGHFLHQDRVVALGRHGGVRGPDGRPKAVH